MPVAISACDDCGLAAARGAREGPNRRFGPYASSATPFASDRPVTGDVWEVAEFVVLPIGSRSTCVGPYLPVVGWDAGWPMAVSHVTRTCLTACAGSPVYAEGDPEIWVTVLKKREISRPIEREGRLRYRGRSIGAGVASGLTEGGR